MSQSQHGHFDLLDRPWIWPWTQRSLVFAAVVSAGSLLVSIRLADVGAWPEGDWTHQAVAALIGGAALWFRHPRTWPLVLLLFVPLAFLITLLLTLPVGLMDAMPEPY